MTKKSYHNDNRCVEIFKALGDESRLKIVSILLEKDSYTEYLSNRLNLTPPTVTYHMDKLEKAGLVKSTKIQHYVIYSINEEILGISLEKLINETMDFVDNRTYEEKVINAYFKYDKLTQLPTQIKKREVVLGYIAEKFEIGKVYSAKDLASTIVEIYEDYCTIKKDLIGMGFFCEEKNEYKRIK